MYKIFTDKGKTFKCNIDISGASLNDCSARLLLETKDGTFLYKGSVNRDGVCEVDIPKIKIIEEGIEGKIKLEVIVENTLFNPWESDFVVAVSKKVQVQVDEEEDSKPVTESNKTDDNKMKVSVIMDEEDEEEVVNEKNVEPSNEVEDVKPIDNHERDTKVNELVNNKQIDINKSDIKTDTPIRQNKAGEDIFDFESFLNKK